MFIAFYKKKQKNVNLPWAILSRNEIYRPSLFSYTADDFSYTVVDFSGTLNSTLFVIKCLKHVYFSDMT